MNGGSRGCFGLINFARLNESSGRDNQGDSYGDWYHLNHRGGGGGVVDICDSEKGLDSVQDGYEEQEF